MATPSHQFDRSNQLRFGVFEADLRSGELTKRGARIHLPEKPFRVLAALLSRPGEMLTRQELQQRLWPGETFVDFDNNLNAAVRKLREALGDSADSPRFVETLPKRGYRFIAPVEPVVRGVEAVAPVDPSVPDRAGGGWKRRGVFFGLALTVLAVAVVAVLFVGRGGPPEATGSGGDRLMLAVMPSTLR